MVAFVEYTEDSQRSLGHGVKRVVEYSRGERREKADAGLDCVPLVSGLVTAPH